MVVKKICTVVAVGPGADGNETTPPVIYIQLAPDDNSFFNLQWFYAAEAGKSEMLAVALMAFSMNRKVSVSIEFPNPPAAPDSAGTPYTACYRMFLL